MVYAWSRRIDEHDRVIGDMGEPRHAGNVVNQLLASNFIRNASSAIFRRDLALAVGGFDPNLRRAGAQGAEDLKIFLAIARIAEVALAPYYLTGYRLVMRGMSQDPDRMRRSVEMVLREHEAAGADGSEALFDLARMNYDLYAGGLALASRQWPVFASYVWRAVRRRPVEAGVFLSLSALWMTATMFRRRSSRKTFAALAEDDHKGLPLNDWFTRFQTGSVEKAAWRGPTRTRDAEPQA